MATAEANTQEVRRVDTPAEQDLEVMQRVETGNFVLFHEILEERRETVSVINGRATTLWYNPAAFTPELETEINKMETGKHKSMSEPILKMVGDLLIDWDVMLPNPDDPNGRDREKADFAKYPPIPFPPTLENLRKVPFDVLIVLIRDIVIDLRPKKKNG